MPTPLEYEFMAASLCPTAAPRSLGVMLVDQFNRVWSPNGLGGHTLAADLSAGGGGGAVNAPATLNASNAGLSGTVNLAAAGTMTVHDGAWALLPAGLVIQVAQSGSATLAFSGTATKENASGTSASSVTLAASGVYALTQSPTGAAKFRLSGGAAL